MRDLINPMKTSTNPDYCVRVKARNSLADLGKPEEIGRVFARFQKYLYQGGA